MVKEMIETKEVWFSHREKKWEVEDNKFLLFDEKKIWDWDHCTIGITRNINNQLMIVVRSKTTKPSRYMGNKPVELRFMLGFDVNGVPEPPKSESYTARASHPDPLKKEGPKERWVLQLDDDYWIWEWAEEGGEISSSYINTLYQLIREEISSPSIKSDNIFDVVDVVGDQEKRVIPVIYQPAVDTLDNFVREVHCAKKSANADGSYDVEVTIIFNNEELRKHSYGGIGNIIYERIRKMLHGRILDIETFEVLVRDDAEDKKFTFENIYSDDHTLKDDNVHGDFGKPIPKHEIRYYFINHNHPVVFVNTSNHAMAEHDTNHGIWKWEYVPWADNIPIILGGKSRKEIDKSFEPHIIIRILKKIWDSIRKYL